MKGDLVKRVQLKNFLSINVNNKLHAIKPTLGEWTPYYRSVRREESQEDLKWKFPGENLYLEEALGDEEFGMIDYMDGKNHGLTDSVSKARKIFNSKKTSFNELRMMAGNEKIKHVIRRQQGTKEITVDDVNGCLGVRMGDG
ncbi:hypothetical protein CHS0354_015107 [Potamilus streckersoni]|uniref:Uncharacterized protein n=1 Tax=Potamilus streckersoni TaxID=2493646 RepID=A0AAE0SRA0_9BIVA|nr:hypothetical protein CHS0354_015107 [Potamilus streckersoni]